MTFRRVVALAQALTMILLLLPGPLLVGPSPVRAALQPAEPDPETVYDAAGKGIGCQAGTRKYKGPGLPKDPPWPPGAEPTPSPVPSEGPAAEAASTDTTEEPSVGPDASPVPEAGAFALVAATDVPVSQIESGAAPVSAPTAKSTFITGIDVSHHNGDIDYGKVKAAGHRFVYIKATQDNDFVDPMFPTNLARARAAGLAAGAYHFFDYTLDGREQADHFLDRVEAAGGIVDALPPVVDVECWKPIGASIHAVSATRLRDFVARVYERIGRMPVIYTSVHMWREVVGNAEGFEQQPLWAACWGCDAPPDLAPGWDGWTFWQTGLSRIPGVGRLDGNFFGGTKRDLRQLKLRPFSIAGGAVATAGGDVELDLGGRDASHIRTSPDGETWSKWSQIRGTPTAPIPATEGEHAVFAQFRNGPGLRSAVVSDSIIVDQTPPDLSGLTVALREGSLDGGIPVAVRWDARDAMAGLSDATVAVGCGDDRVRRTEAPGSAEPGQQASWEAEAFITPGGDCTVTAIAADGAGNTARATSDSVTVSDVPANGDQPTTMVNADQAGIIARRGPDLGRAAVLLDGDAVALIDLYAPEVGEPEVILVLDLGGGEHTIEIEPTDSSDPASSGTGVVIEGFASLDR